MALYHYQESKRVRILNAEPLGYSTAAKNILFSIGEVHDRILDRASLLSCLNNYEILIVRLGFVIDQEVIHQGKCLKAIVTATTGLDHIDLEYAAKRGIEVLSLRGEFEFLRGIPATAEHTWALLLSLVRKIPWAVLTVVEGQWERELFRGHDLAMRHLGIIGLGRIGEKVARFGLAFGMKVSAFDPNRQNWPSEVERHSSLQSLLTTADVVSLHVPLNEATYHMIGNDELQLMKRNAYLLNTSRGAILNSIALLESLEQGHLGGAALDVIEDEMDRSQLIKNPLITYAREHVNLIITPHIGGATYESMDATELFMAQKLKGWCEQGLNNHKREKVSEQ